jgi:hypothetical protein
MVGTKEEIGTFSKIDIKPDQKQTKQDKYKSYSALFGELTRKFQKLA